MGGVGLDNLLVGGTRRKREDVHVGRGVESLHVVPTPPLLPTPVTLGVVVVSLQSPGERSRRDRFYHRLSVYADDP